MYKNFKISDEEKRQILEMHQVNGYKQPINENLDTPKIQHHVNNLVNNLSDEEVQQLMQQLSAVGITPESSSKHIMNVVKSEDAGVQQDMAEDMKKEKVADILDNVASGLAASLLVPIIPVAIGHAMNIGFGGGLAIHAAATALLFALAKALGKRENGGTEHGNY